MRNPLLAALLLGMFASGASAESPDLPREMPTQVAFEALVRDARASWDESLKPLWGAQIEGERWRPRPLDGCSPDPEAERFTLSLSKYGTIAVYPLREAIDPSAETREEMTKDYLQLEEWLLGQAGDWEVGHDFDKTTSMGGESLVTRLSPPDDLVGLRFIHLELARGAAHSSQGTIRWSLSVVLSARMQPQDLRVLGGEPLPAASVVLDMPTEAAFGELVELMKAGAYEQLESIKGLSSPRKLWKRNGGGPRWGVKPMEGMRPDLEGVRNHLADFGRTSQVRYVFGRVGFPEEPDREQLAATFKLMRSWMAQHTDGWAVKRTFSTWSMQQKDSGYFALVPLPGSKVERLDGEPVPRIELWLSKSNYDQGQKWSLTLECQVLGTPRSGDGRGAWIAEAIAGTEPAEELPPILAHFEAAVLKIVAGSADNFASSQLTGEPLEFDPERERVPGEGIFLPRYQPRFAVHNPFRDDQDPGALRDHLVKTERGSESSTYMRLALFTVAAPNANTKLVVNARMLELRERLAALLPGWRLKLDEFPAGRSGVAQRVATFQGLRADGHPVWIGLERSSWKEDGADFWDREYITLALYLATDNRMEVGYDLRAAWEAELASDTGFLRDVIRVLGDPLEGRLQDGDRVVPPGGVPLRALTLFGEPGETELRLPIVRDGRFDELVIEQPQLSLARYRELQAEAARGELNPVALAFLATRIDGRELSGLLRDVLAAVEADPTALPAELEGLAEVTVDHELFTTVVPLYASTIAPTRQLLDGVMAALGNTFDGSWIIDKDILPVGPPWDVYGELAHWSAWHEGPKGLAPWVELVEVALGGDLRLELRIHAFSEAHVVANRTTPERLWFQPITGDCESGRGMAYCYRTGLTFDGPFEDGLPNGTGEHIFEDGKALVDVVYKRGRLEYGGREKPEPVAELPTAGEQRGVWIDGYYLDLQDSDALDYWGGGFDEWLEPAPEPVYEYESYGRRCENCWGSGSVWTTVEVAVYEDTMAFSGSAAWRAGYDVIREWSTAYVDELVTCSYCRGTGYRDW